MRGILQLFEIFVYQLFETSCQEKVECSHNVLLQLATAGKISGDESCRELSIPGTTSIKQQLMIFVRTLCFQELAVARTGQTLDPNAGRVALDAKFGSDDFKYGYLCKQNALWAAIGFNVDRFSPSVLVEEADEMFVVAYPSFNPKGTYMLHSLCP